jgi:hypothetical protein
LVSVIRKNRRSTAIWALNTRAAGLASIALTIGSDCGVFQSFSVRSM